MTKLLNTKLGERLFVTGRSIFSVTWLDAFFLILFSLYFSYLVEMSLRCSPGSAEETGKSSYEILYQTTVTAVLYNRHIAVLQIVLHVKAAHSYTWLQRCYSVHLEVQQRYVSPWKKSNTKPLQRLYCTVNRQFQTVRCRNGDHVECEGTFTPRFRAAAMKLYSTLTSSTYHQVVLPSNYYISSSF